MDTGDTGVVKQQDNNIEQQPEKKPTGFQLNPQNINRNGRPPKNWSWAELLEKVGDELAPGEEVGGKTFKELVSKRLWLECVAGNINAIKELFNRTEGLPRIKMEVDGKVDTGSDEVAKLLQLMYAQYHENEGTDNTDKAVGQDILQK